MHGKVCLVTGASSGLGLVTAQGLAGRGAHVVLLCRNAASGADATARVAAAGGSAELVLADLSEPDQVRRAADAVRARHPRLDVLVCNAGAYLPHRRLTSLGHELTFASNHLGHFLLTRLLLEPVARGNHGRVIVLSSRSHREGSLALLDDPHRERRRWHGYLAYGDSKLANLLFVREAARRLRRTGVAINAVHPGVVRTGFAQDEPGWLHTLFRLASPVFTSPENGAATTLHLATHPDGHAHTGGYWVRQRLARPAAAALDEAAARRLWELSEALVGEVPPLPPVRGAP